MSLRAERGVGLGLRLAAAVIITVVMLFPVYWLFSISFKTPDEIFAFPPVWYPQSIQFGNYAVLFKDGDAVTVLNSLIIAVLSAALAVSIAFPLAYFLWRHRVWYAQVLFGLGVAPFMLPPVITALGFLLFWVNAGLYGNMIATLISHAIFFVTLPLVTISLGLESIDRQIIEASTTMGADSRKVFSTVVLPMVRPYLVSGYAFAFVLSLNEYIVAYMVAGFTVETLPIKIFNSLRYGYTPVMAAVAVVFVLVAILVFGLIARFGDLPKLLGAWSSKET